MVGKAAQNRKGLAQLHHGITKFAAGHDITEAATGLRVVAGQVTKVIPVIVHYEQVLATPGIPMYMAERFKQLGEIRGIAVSTLVMLPISQLENLDEYLLHNDMAPALESHATQLAKHPSTIFLTSSLPILENAVRRPGPTRLRMSRHYDEMLRRVFPSSRPPSSNRTSRDPET